MQLRQAKRNQTKIKLGVFGPAGSGKTYTSLLIAYGLCKDWSKIGVICTEWQDDYTTAADLYSDMGDFQILPLKPPYSPERIVNAMHACKEAGMEVVIIDSISHEWEGQGGILEDSKSHKHKNDFAVWDVLGKRHRRMVDAITMAPYHMIITGRTKIDYVLEETVNASGKTVMAPIKKGTKVVTREGLDYEVTLAFVMDMDHYAVCEKDRLFGMENRFIDRELFKPSIETGEEILAWCNSGQEVSEETKQAQETMKHIRIYCQQLAIDTVEKLQEATGLDSLEGKTLDELQSALLSLGKIAIQRGLQASPIPNGDTKPDNETGDDDGREGRNNLPGSDVSDNGQNQPVGANEVRS